MDNKEDPIRKCDKCKISKPKSLFYRYKYCKRCHIINYINMHLLNARVANHLNLSIDELNNILKIDMNDSTRNGIGEHDRYDEVMLLMTGWNMPPSISITENVINNFLNE
jgi:hypothetical protein